MFHLFHRWRRDEAERDFIVDRCHCGKVRICWPPMGFGFCVYETTDDETLARYKSEE